MNTFEYTAKRIDFRGYEIQTYSFGTGSKDILSFPSFASSGLYYLFFTSYYNHKNFRFITFDVPGWAGWSDNMFKREPFAIETLVEIGKAVADEYNVEKSNIIGYSYGGAMAIAFAHTYPELVHKVALISPVAYNYIYKKHILYKLYRSGKVLNTVKFPAGLFVKQIIDFSMFSRVWPEIRKMVSPDMIALIKTMHKKNCNKVLFDAIDVLFNTNLDDETKAVGEKHPFMIVNSAEEWKFFRQQAEHIRRLLDHEKSFKITGHHEDFLGRAPESKTVREVMDFLTK